MGTTVYLKLKAGERIHFGRCDGDTAIRVVSTVENWIRRGTTVALANSQGAIVEVNLRDVLMVEVIDDPTPPRGSRLAPPLPLQNERLGK
jgi:hypothetical protein